MIVVHVDRLKGSFLAKMVEELMMPLDCTSNQGVRQTNIPRAASAFHVADKRDSIQNLIRVVIRKQLLHMLKSHVLLLMLADELEIQRAIDRVRMVQKALEEVFVFQN